MLKIHYEGNKKGLLNVIEDCMQIFNIGPECLLNLDLQGYKDSFMLSSLVGAPPGYVGYEDEGLLSKHILSYPFSVLVFKNFKFASPNIQSFLLNLISCGFFTDQKGRSISLENVIIILEGMEEKEVIGFQKNASHPSDVFDETIREEGLISDRFNEKFQKALSRMHYEISFDFNIDSNNKKKVEEYLYQFTRKNKNGKYEIKEEDL